MANNSGRRAPGEGSLFKRADGRWCAQYRVELPTGGQKTRYLYAKTKGEASAKLRRALGERDAGLVFDDGSLTVGEYLGKWLDTVRDTVKHRTWERYEEIVRVHLKPTLGGIRLGRLTPMEVQTMYRAKLDSGLSARTVQIIHTTLHKSLKQAVRWRLVARNVCEDVDPPRSPRREVQPLSAAQTRALLMAAEGDPLEALYTLAVTTGMRQGELLGLKWEDLDSEGCVLQVRRTVWEGKSTAPKTSRARRSIRLSKMAVRALEVHRENRRIESAWVFASETGTPLDCHHLITRYFKPLLKRASLPEATRFHDLRHTCATLLLSKGVHPKLVQELLGHADISTTMNTYSHVVPSMHGATAQAMDSVLASQASESGEGASLVPLEGCEPEQVSDLVTGSEGMR